MAAYPSRRAGYYGAEAIDLPTFPKLLFDATCPRCLATVAGPRAGLLMRSAPEGDQHVARILSHHVCEVST